MFLGVFLYAVGFVGGFLTPTRLDAPMEHSDSASFPSAILIDLLLVVLFAVQHSIASQTQNALAEDIGQETFARKQTELRDQLASITAIDFCSDSSCRPLSSHSAINRPYWFLLVCVPNGPR